MSSRVPCVSPRGQRRTCSWKLSNRACQRSQIKRFATNGSRLFKMQPITSSRRENLKRTKHKRRLRHLQDPLRHRIPDLKLGVRIDKAVVLEPLAAVVGLLHTEADRTTLGMSLTTIVVTMPRGLRQPTPKSNEQLYKSNYRAVNHRC